MNSESPLNRQDRRRSGDFVMVKRIFAIEAGDLLDLVKLRTSVTIEAGIDFLNPRNCIAAGDIPVICKE